MMRNPLEWLQNLLFLLPGLVIGFTIHEFSHAAMAVRLGDGTPRLEGRLTLNPSAHIDWVGMLLFVLLGWGYARPVHIVPGNLKGRAWGEAAVSAMGPASNFLAAATLFALFSLLPDGMWSPFLLAGSQVNLTLCFLNLLPLPPLDGFHVLRAFLPLKWARGILQLERYGVLILLALSFTGVLGRYLGFAQGISLALFFKLFG